MVSSKKKAQLWKKALVHFSLCFVMGFFTGFMPTGKNTNTSSVFHGGYPPETSKAPAEQPPTQTTAEKVPQTTVEESVPSRESETDRDFYSFESPKKRLLIIVTATSARDKNREALVRRMANTLSLVEAPVLWVVVEAAATAEEEELPEILRKSRVMHRHLVVKEENFTDWEVEMDRQRNIALAHIEHHRISGIVHFAGIRSVYDLRFFQQIREIEVFGTWPVAFLSPNRKRVVTEGPVCKSSQVIGWHQRTLGNQTDDSNSLTPSSIHISSFAFNSSILWDPERWGRTSPVQDTTQNSIKFVKQVVVEDEAKLRGIPSGDCSKVLLWHLHFPTATAPN